MVDVVIVQHAERDRTPGDPGLTDLGRRQAAETATFLSSVPGGVLCSSPLRRARDTAAAIGEACGLGVAIDERLRERMNWGDAPSSQTFDEFLADWRRATHDRSWTPPSGDSSNATAARMLEAINELVTSTDGPRLLVASHGGATVDLLRTLFGDDSIRAAVPKVIEEGVPNCALTRLAFDGSWRLVGVGDTRHLPRG